MTCSLRPALLSLVLLAACGPSTTAPPPDAADDAPAAVDVPPDASPDASPDVAADVTVDARPDVIIDASVDAAPDRAAMDAAPDARPDVTSPDGQVTPDAPPDGPVTGAVCGTRGVPPCGEGLYCNYPPSAICGAADAPGRCAVIPRGCTRELDPVCGCDGRDYNNPCLAASAGTSVASMGPCRSTDGGRPDASTCAAQDARGSGACARFFGYVWNGASCAGISGCSCAGAACASLYDSPEACQAAHSTCDCRTVGCSSTSTCQACRGPGGLVYACIPRGAAC